MVGDSVVELRQYTLRGGQRETLISLFEKEFVAPLNEVGCFVRGTFRDLDDPDRFVWIRGFSDMPSRKRALEAFYGGQVWQRYRAAANATMIDSDNVLLLRPAETVGAAAVREPRVSGSAEMYSVIVHYLNGASISEFVAFYRTTIRPRLAALGAVPRMELQTEKAANNFPRLPVREREEVFLWIGKWPGVDEFQAFQERWAKQSGWRNSAPESVMPALMRKPEILRLAPTAGSELS
jgi:quinol monooxygenase YgiN